MMTNDELALQVARGLEIGNQILQRAWDTQALRGQEARQLAAELRQAAQAAEELERRANLVVIDV